MLLHAGLVCSTFLPGLVRGLRPLLAPLSLLDTCACVGASLSLNAAAARSSLGAMVLLPASIPPPSQPVVSLHVAVTYAHHIHESQHACRHNEEYRRRKAVGSI